MSTIRVFINFIRRPCRNPLDEFRSLPQFAQYFHSSSVRLDDSVDQAQAKTGSMNLVVHSHLAPEKRIEDVGQLGTRNSGPVIGYPDFDHHVFLRRRRGGGDADPSSFGG